MPDTFIKIASVTVGSGGASSIDFTSIPSTYTDLCVKVSVRSNYSAYVDNLIIKLNNSSASFTNRTLVGYATSVASGTNDNSGQNVGNATAALATSNTFASGDIYLPNYAGSNNKSFSTDNVTETNDTSNAFLKFVASLWSNTSAINQVTLVLAAGSFVQYSTATLYGIKNS